MKDHRFLMYFVCKFSFCFKERESTYGPRFEFLTTSAAKEFVDLAMTTMSSIAAKRRISQSFGISASSLPRLLLAQSYAVGYGRTVYARGKVPWGMGERERERKREREKDRENFLLTIAKELVKIGPIKMDLCNFEFMKSGFFTI